MNVPVCARSRAGLGHIPMDRICRRVLDSVSGKCGCLGKGKVTGGSRLGRCTTTTVCTGVLSFIGSCPSR